MNNEKKKKALLARRAEVVAASAPERAHIQEILDHLNEDLAFEKLHLQDGDRKSEMPADIIDRVIIRFAEVRSNLRRLEIDVGQTGIVSVAIGTIDHRPTRTYKFELLDCEPNMFEGAVLDFVVANLPEGALRLHRDDEFKP
jgi:hypothetical protein